MRSPFLEFTRRLHFHRQSVGGALSGGSLRVLEKALPDIRSPVRIVEDGAWASVNSIHEILGRLRPFLYLEKKTVRGLKYQISRLKDFKPDSREETSKLPDHGKELYFDTICNRKTLKHNLSWAYRFLLNGSRVEFHLRPPANGKVHTIDWALENALHLRPDMINSAMPAGTEQLLPPFQLKKDLIWVLEHKQNREKALGIKQLLAVDTTQNDTDLVVVHQKNLLLRALPNRKAVRDSKEPKIQAQLVLDMAEANQLFPPKARLSALEAERREIKDQRIREDELPAKERRTAPETNIQELEDSESRGGISPLVFSGFRMSNGRRHVQAQKAMSMEEPTMPSTDSSDGHASVVILEPHDDPTAVNNKDVPAEGDVKPEAGLSSESLLSSYKAFKPAQKEIEAIHDTGIEGSTSSSSECSQEAAPEIQRKHFAVRKYHAKIFKPEEPLMSIVHRTRNRHNITIEEYQG